MAYDFINDVFNTGSSVSMVPTNYNVPYAGLTPGMVANPYPGHPYGSNALAFNNTLPGVANNNMWNAEHGKPLIGGEWPVGGIEGITPSPVPAPTPTPTPDPTPTPPSCPPGYVWDSNANACVPMPKVEDPTTDLTPDPRKVDSNLTPGLPVVDEHTNTITGDFNYDGKEETLPVTYDAFDNPQIDTNGDGVPDANVAHNQGDWEMFELINPEAAAEAKAKQIRNAELTQTFLKGIPLIGGFVGNKIVENAQNTAPSNWQYVPGTTIPVSSAASTIVPSKAKAAATQPSGPAAPGSNTDFDVPVEPTGTIQGTNETITLPTSKPTPPGSTDLSQAKGLAKGSAKAAIDSGNANSATVNPNGSVTLNKTTSSGTNYTETVNPGGGSTFSTKAPGGGYIVGNSGGKVGAYNIGGNVMPLASILTQGMNLGGKVKKIYNEGYTAPGQAYAIAKSMGYNYGGMVGYNQGGMTSEQVMSQHPYNREGMHNDTVSARLTPGEFVIDADSTHAIEQMAPGMLDRLNSWEPHMGKDKLVNDVFNTLDDVTITKKRKDGNSMTIKSAEGSRLADMFGGN